MERHLLSGGSHRLLLAARNKRHGRTLKLTIWREAIGGHQLRGISDGERHLLTGGKHSAAISCGEQGTYALEQAVGCHQLRTRHLLAGASGRRSSTKESVTRQGTYFLEVIGGH